MLQVRRPRRGRRVVPRAKASAVHRSLAVYERDGYAVVRGAVAATMVAAALRHLASMPGDGPLRTAPIERDPFLAEVAALPALVAIARAALAGEVEPFGCTYLVKPPTTGLPVRWHQDGHPWETRGITRAVTIGIALDRATPENGCLLVIPGSHHLDARPLRPVLEPPNVFGAEVDPGLVDTTAAVAVPLAAGDVSVHHPNLLHGSDANRSARPRTSLIVRYRAGASVPDSDSDSG